MAACSTFYIVYIELLQPLFNSLYYYCRWKRNNIIIFNFNKKKLKYI